MSDHHYIDKITAKGLLSYTVSLPKIWLLIFVSTLHHLITVGAPFFLIFIMSQLWFISNPITYIQLAIGFLILGSLWILTSYIKDLVFYNILFDYSSNMSQETINMLLNLPYNYIGNLPVESQFSRFSPLENLSYIWLNSIVKPILDLPLIIIAFSIICYILGFPFFCYMAVIVSIVLFFNNYKTKFKKNKKEVSDTMFHGTIKDSFNNMSLIKSHHRTSFFTDKINELIQKRTVGKYITDSKSIILSNVSESSLLFLYIGSLTFAVYYALYGIIDIKLLIVVLLLTWFSIAPFKTILSAIEEIPKAKELVKQFTNLKNVNNAKHRHKKQKLADNFTGQIKLVNVNTNFPTGGKFTLNNINISTNRGEVLLLNGPSGSGKSVILKLINGLYKQFTGSIYIDQDINQIDEDSLRENVLYINPDVYFDSLSIKNNIKFNNNDTGHYTLQQIIDQLNLRTDANSNVVSKYQLNDFKNIQSNKISYDEIVNKIIISKLNPDIKNKIILLDEPLLENTDNEFLQLARLINILKENNTIIIASRYNFYAPLGDKVVILNNGKIEKVWERQ